MPTASLSSRLSGLSSRLKPPPVHTVTIVKENAPPQLENFLRVITVPYIDSRVLLAEASVKEGVEDDPLEYEVLRTEQRDVLAQLGRCKY